MGRKGSEFRKLLSDPTMVGEKREAFLQQALDNGEIPDWVWAWQPVTVSRVINGKERTLTYWVSPDVLAIGTNDDFMRVRPWPSTAQWFANKHDLVMPTTRISDQVYDAAPFKFVPTPVHPHSIATDSWFKSDDVIKNQGVLRGYFPGVGIAAGFMKDVVNGPNLDGKKVAIYGWHDPTRTITGNNPIQPYSTIHEATFSDYSHGLRLVRRGAILDGTEIDLGKLMKDPELYPLVQKMPSEQQVAGEGGPLTNDKFPITSANSPNMMLMSILADPDEPATISKDSATKVEPGGGGGGGGGGSPTATSISSSSSSEVWKVIGGVLVVAGVGYGVGKLIQSRMQHARAGHW